MDSSDPLIRDLLAHEGWIRSLARRLVGNEEAAEDLVQDVMVAALDERPSPVRGLRAWLGGVVRNLGARRKRESVHRRRREAMTARPDRLPSVVEMREQVEARVRVARAVFHLEEPYRSTILYRFFENLPPREIAGRLEISVAAVESRLRRGIRMLRARLDRDFGDRASWCAVLAPAIGTSTAGTAAAAGSTLALPGAFVMSTAMKVAIVVLLVLGVAYTVWPESAAVKPQTQDHAERTEPAPVAGGTAGPNGSVEPDTKARAIQQPSRSAPVPGSLQPARGTIVGRVTQVDGHPIAGATVRSLRFTPTSVDLPEILVTTTDATSCRRSSIAAQWRPRPRAGTAIVVWRARSPGWTSCSASRA